MSKRRAVSEPLTVTHPDTGQQLVIKCMEGGGFNVGFPNADPDKPMRWAVSGIFTGGTSGTNMSLVQIPE